MAKKMKQTALDIPPEARTPDEKLAAMRALDRERRAKCLKLDGLDEQRKDLKTEIDGLVSRILPMVEESDRDPLPFPAADGDAAPRGLDAGDGPIRRPGYRKDLDG